MKDELASGRGIEITEIGAKPGEKTSEELMNAEEVRRTYEYGDFFVTLSAFADATAPAYAHFINCPRPNRPYNSALEMALDRGALARFFQGHKLFPRTK